MEKGTGKKVAYPDLRYTRSEGNKIKCIYIKKLTKKVVNHRNCSETKQHVRLKKFLKKVESE